MLLGLPPEARVGTWVFEWYWKQPAVPHVKEFVADIRKKSGGHVPTARTWFGYAAIWTCALAAAQAKSLDAVKMAKAMQDFKLTGSRADAGRRLLSQGTVSAHP